jgi:hypothetical protein
MHKTAILLCASLAVATAVSGCGRAPTAPTSPPIIFQVTPTSAAVGDTVTISGSGFPDTGNAIRIGAGYLLNVSSPDGTTLRFTLPGYLGVCAPGAKVCLQIALALTPGEYGMSVINALGTSNEVRLQIVGR